MKHLNRFKTFENVSSNDWGVLLDAFQSDIFDEWNIQKIKDESFEGDENDPDYKLWAFRTDRGTLSSELTNDVNTLSIYNIPLDESDEFWNSLIEVTSFVSEMISKEVVVSEEAFGRLGNYYFNPNDSNLNSVFNDYDIKISR